MTDYPPAPPVPTPDTLVDIAYQNLRKDITVEYLPAGKKINLSHLCTRYGISPTPLKQALNRLIAEGLVENIPRKGCRVRKFSWTDASELFEMRLMMETHFAPQVTNAVRINSKLQSMFEANLKENLELAQNFQTAEEYFRTYALDQKFHELFILSSGNRTALRVYSGLYSHSYAAYLYGKQPRAQTISGILEHQEIYRTMLDGDAQKVRVLLQSHIENARKKILLFLKLQQNAK